MQAETHVKMAQHVKISQMVSLIVLIVVVYLDTREPFAKRTLMNANRTHAKTVGFVLMTLIVTHACVHRTLKE